MKWLVLGAGGMLGRAVMREAAMAGVEAVPWELPKFSLAEPPRRWPSFPDGVTQVLNCAAYTDVDGAESNEGFATVLNANAVRALSERCAHSDALLVHLSTDYVFDGAASSPYEVKHPRNPVNAYGRSKALGEAHLENGHARFLCVRTSWLYAPWGKNFVRTIRGLMQRRDHLNVVNDQRGRPTSAEHLAAALCRLIERNIEGFVHVTDGGDCSWYELARHVADCVGWAGRLEPCKTHSFPRPARRPEYSVLDLTQTERALGPRPTWTQNVKEVLEQLDRTEPFRADTAPSSVYDISL